MFEFNFIDWEVYEEEYQEMQNVLAEMAKENSTCG